MSEQNEFDPFSSFSNFGQLFTSTGSVLALREFLKNWPAMVEVEPPAIGDCHDISLSCEDRDVLARVYLPMDSSPREPGPCLVFFHGGGFMVGTLDTHDKLLRRLCAVSGIRIVSIDYRLAPEHPFPAGWEDALASTEAVLNGALCEYGVDADQIAVGGDSAGGNFAASVAQILRNRIQFQLLIYPVLQLAEIEDRSMRMQDVPLLSKAILKEISQNYVGDHDPMDPKISPLMTDNLSGLPPCYFLAAELDPLFPEGEAYCAKLAASGVSVERRVFKTTTHGFLNFTRVMPVAVKAIEAMAHGLREGLIGKA
jgi:acetyl esterase